MNGLKVSLAVIMLGCVAGDLRSIPCYSAHFQVSFSQNRHKRVTSFLGQIFWDNINPLRPPLRSVAIEIGAFRPPSTVPNIFRSLTHW